MTNTLNSATNSQCAIFISYFSPPLEHSHPRVDGEGLGRVLEPNHTPGLEQLLVDVGVRLQLDCLVGRVLQLQPGCSQIISSEHDITIPKSNRN